MGKLNNNTTGKGNKVTTHTHTTNTPNPQPVQGTVPTVTMVPTTKQTPVKKGTSNIPNPVGMVWVTCIQVCFTVQTVNGVNTYVPVPVTPTRKHLHTLCMGLGITFYTYRTQVQQFLKATNGGTNLVGVKLPKGVNLP